VGKVIQGGKMKRVISLVVLVVMVFSLSSCFLSNNYSASSMKSGLEKAGFSVVENPYISSLDYKDAKGLQKVVYGYKTVNGEEVGVLLFVFDSIDNVSAFTDASSERLGVINDWARKHASNEEGGFVGTANNVFWAGDKEGRIAAGIKLLTD
jgi:hypothetical protein